MYTVSLYVGKQRRIQPFFFVFTTTYINNNTIDIYLRVSFEQLLVSLDWSTGIDTGMARPLPTYLGTVPTYPLLSTGTCTLWIQYLYNLWLDLTTALSGFWISSFLSAHLKSTCQMTLSFPKTTFASTFASNQLLSLLFLRNLANTIEQLSHQLLHQINFCLCCFYKTSQIQLKKYCTVYSRYL